MILAFQGIKKIPPFQTVFNNNRARRIRTADLNVPNVARYQLRYCPCISLHLSVVLLEALDSTLAADSVLY